MAGTAAYDRYADWYEDYVTGAAAAHTRRVEGVIGQLLGPGDGPCLDVCCGTGVHAPVMRALGWRPLGVDVSRGQLRHAATRLEVVAGDATALPIIGGSVPAALCALGHTDVPDYAAVVREVARALRPGGRFVHVGVHPCFCGAFADGGQPDRVVLGPGYGASGHTFEGWSPHGVRARLGAWHLPLADLLGTLVDAGLTLVRAVEDGPDGGLPDLLALAARKPAP
jgi:SAM-dependent methyltransferase